VQDDDRVFRALGDPARRRLLDRLYERDGQTLRELCVDMGMTRPAVSKHLAVLAEAQLVVVLRRGRETHHFLNPAPISELAGRWIGKYDRRRLDALAAMKRDLEEHPP